MKTTIVKLSHHKAGQCVFVATTHVCKLLSHRISSDTDAIK